jgi:hypothetical protein
MIVAEQCWDIIGTHFPDIISVYNDWDSYQERGSTTDPQWYCRDVPRT